MNNKTWSDAKYIKEARREPDRLVFWQRYYPDDILEASKCVCENPPRFDNSWAQEFPLRSWLKKRALIGRSPRPQSPNIKRDVICPHWYHGPNGDPIYKCAYHPDLVTCGIKPCRNKRAN
jgi:hypothetical protein